MHESTLVFWQPDSSHMPGHQYQCCCHPAHTAKLVEKWLDTLGVKLIKLPAKSPDLNPIENVWSVVSRQVYPGTTTYNTKESLLVAIRAAWETVRANHTLRQHLVDSMTRRFQAVVRMKGGPTKF